MALNRIDPRILAGMAALVIAPGILGCPVSSREKARSGDVAPVGSASVPSGSSASAPGRSASTPEAVGSATQPANEPPPPPEPTPTGRPPSLADKSFASWTDSRVIDALVQDCALKVTIIGPSDEPDPLSCDLPFQQSCVDDPCFSQSEECKSSCGQTCRTCDGECANRCASCKAGCADDVCRRKCAESCGQCKQSCIKVRDKCATAGCAKAAQACKRAQKRAWAAAGCTKKCPKIDACFDACDRDMACAENCRKRFKECQVEYCVIGAPPELP